MGHRLKEKTGFFLVYLGILFVFCFWMLSFFQPPAKTTQEFDLEPQVVLPAVIQAGLYGGDRFLAANVESVRAAASGRSLEARAGGYQVRAHRAVAQLNPCHEDNYWIGNASLSFGGQSEMGNELLIRATRCRYWDEVPPFLLGFNLKFFNGRVGEAVEAMEVAAQRSTKNAAGFRQMAILMRANSLNDAHAALSLLSFERDNTPDQGLRIMLTKRVVRLEGLILLREAKKYYESRFSKKLKDPNELITSDIISEIPNDPINLGYELRDDEFHLKQVRIAGFN